MFSDAAVIDVLRSLRTGRPGGGPAPEVRYGRRKMTKWLVRNGSVASGSGQWTG